MIHQWRQKVRAAVNIYNSKMEFTYFLFCHRDTAENLKTDVLKLVPLLFTFISSKVSACAAVDEGFGAFTLVEVQAPSRYNILL